MSNIKLISQDGETFEVLIEQVKLSQLILTMLEDENEIEQEIPLPNVNSDILSKIIEFLIYYSTEPMKEIEKPLKSLSMSDIVSEWYCQFIDVSLEKLSELIAAANYLDIRPLLDLTCAAIAIQIKGKTPDEIRSHFNLVNDFTPAEEAQIIEECKWSESNI